MIPKIVLVVLVNLKNLKFNHVCFLFWIINQWLSCILYFMIFVESPYTISLFLVSGLQKEDSVNSPFNPCCINICIKLSKEVQRTFLDDYFDLTHSSNPKEALLQITSLPGSTLSPPRLNHKDVPDSLKGNFVKYCLLTYWHDIDRWEISEIGDLAILCVHINIICFSRLSCHPLIMSHTLTMYRAQYQSNRLVKNIFWIFVSIYNIMSNVSRFVKWDLVYTDVNF